MANVDLNKDACEQFICPAIKYLEQLQRTPLRVQDWRGGGWFVDKQEWGPVACYFDDTMAIDELKQKYGMNYKDKEPYCFQVQFAEWVFNANHLVIDDQQHINDLPHEAKVICRCGYIIYGEWIRWRKKFWPDLPLKIN